MLLLTYALSELVDLGPLHLLCLFHWEIVVTWLDVELSRLWGKGRIIRQMSKKCGLL